MQGIIHSIFTMACHEHTVFKSNFSTFALRITDTEILLPHCVDVGLIDPSQLETLLKEPTKQKMNLQLLLHIAGPLESGYCRGFYDLLMIMERHGNRSTSDLATEIKR